MGVIFFTKPYFWFYIATIGEKYWRVEIYRSNFEHLKHISAVKCEKITLNKLIINKMKIHFIKRVQVRNTEDADNAGLHGFKYIQ